MRWWQQGRKKETIMAKSIVRYVTSSVCYHTIDLSRVNSKIVRVDRPWVWFGTVPYCTGWLVNKFHWQISKPRTIYSKNDHVSRTRTLYAVFGLCWPRHRDFVTSDRPIEMNFCGWVGDVSIRLPYIYPNILSVSRRHWLAHWMPHHLLKARWDRISLVDSSGVQC